MGAGCLVLNTEYGPSTRDPGPTKDHSPCKAPRIAVAGLHSVPDPATLGRQPAPPTAILGG
jgi:hypothetical protein